MTLDPNELNLDPSERHGAFLAPGEILNPGREPEAEPEAPTEPKPDATAAAIAQLRADLQQQNASLTSALRERRTEAAAATPAAVPDELEPLLKHEDPEVRALAQRNISLQQQIDKINEDLSDQRLARQESAFRSQYKLTDDEMNEVYRLWGIQAERDPRSWEGLTVEEAARRLIQPAALETRRTKAEDPPKPPLNGATPPAPATPTARMLTEPAHGSSPPTRRVTPTREWSTEDAVELGWQNISRAG